MFAPLFRVQVYLKLKTFVTILFVFLSRILSAQITGPCIDPARVNPFYMCNDPFYNPVCGCDNVTYRNACNAFYVNGVTSHVSGVCSGIDVDFYPNPVLGYELLSVNLGYPEFVMADVDLKIMDAYGKVMEQRIINNFNRTMIQFDVSGYNTGVYILIVQSSLKTGVVEKFSKN